MLKKIFSFRKNPLPFFDDALKRLVTKKLICRDTANIIEGSLRLEKLQVRDIMIPRAKMVVINKNDKFNDILSLMLAEQYSRFPVIDQTTDKVIGILLAKDLLRQTKGSAHFTLESLLRPTLFVPESKKLIKLLNEFRKKHSHMAMVMDEYGNVAGLVTIENVLEQIVGDIIDESDAEEEQKHIIFYQGNGKQITYNVDALTPLEQFNNFFSVRIASRGFDTIGGIVMHAFGYIPKKGESICIENRLIKVMDTDKRRIKKLQVTTN